MPVSLKPFPLTVGLLSVLVSTSAGPQSGKEANYAETGNTTTVTSTTGTQRTWSPFTT